MYQTIIVPLDGSPFAAQAVTTAVEIAKRCRADLVLARVHEAYAYEDTDYSISEDVSRRDQENYLADIAEFIEEKHGIVPERRLLSGAIVPALCTFARGLPEPLIVISTHGRTGLSRAWLGSIADGVASHASTPVLMLHHHGADKGLANPSHTFKGIMVPLDGSDVSESVLPHAVALATAFGSHLTLARVVVPRSAPVPVSALPFAMPPEPIDDRLSSRVDGAQSYLTAIAARLQLENLNTEITTIVRLAESAAPTLLECAEWSSADTIALATRGRGTSRLIVPSLADAILRRGPEAVLIVHEGRPA